MLQIKSRFAVESIELWVGCKKLRLLANSLRSMLNGLPAIAPLWRLGINILIISTIDRIKPTFLGGKCLHVVAAVSVGQSLYQEMPYNLEANDSI